jgi:AcrR family transcriptional regulator
MRYPQNVELQDMPLRARKKQRTREQIALAAARLFARQGFDQTTIAEIARAADVSEQTVYNYFPNKEQLVFDEDAAFEARLVSMVRDRAPGKSLSESVRREAHAFLDELERRPVTAALKGGMPHLIAISPTLRRYWLEMAERHTSAVAKALVLERGQALPPAAAAVIARALTSVFVVIVDEIGRTMRDGGNRRTVLKTLRRQINLAINLLGEGL